MCAAGGGCHSHAVVGSFPEHTGRRRVGTPEEGAYPIPGGTLGYTGFQTKWRGGGVLAGVGNRFAWDRGCVSYWGVWGEVGY